MFFADRRGALVDRAGQHRDRGAGGPARDGDRGAHRHPAVPHGHHGRQRRELPAALSPFAPTGIIVNGLMARNGLPGYEVQTYVYNLLAHARVAFARLRAVRRPEAVRRGTARPRPTRRATRIDAFERRHWITLAVIAALIVSVIVANVHVGMAAFVGAASSCCPARATTARRSSGCRGASSSWSAA